MELRQIATQSERSRARATQYDRRYSQTAHRIYDAIGGKPHLDRTSPSVIRENSAH